MKRERTTLVAESEFFQMLIAYNLCYNIKEAALLSC